MARKDQPQPTWEGYLDVPLVKTDKEAMKKLYDNPLGVMAVLDEVLADGTIKLGVAYYERERSYRTTLTGLQGSLFPGRTIVGFGSTPGKSLVSGLHKFSIIAKKGVDENVLDKSQVDFACDGLQAVHTLRKPIM